MKYAFINGNKYTKFPPIVFVYNNGKYEVICESIDRQKMYYDYFDNRPDLQFDNFLNTFSYQDVETGDVTPDVESMLNRLRSRFMVAQLADQELQNANQHNQESARRDNALLKISKRMRTGLNER